MRWRDYQRHDSRQAEKVPAFLGRMEDECGLSPGRDRIFFTGSGAGALGSLVGAKFVQEVVVVSTTTLSPSLRP